MFVVAAMRPSSVFKRYTDSPPIPSQALPLLLVVLFFCSNKGLLPTEPPPVCNGLFVASALECCTVSAKSCAINFTVAAQPGQSVFPVSENSGMYLFSVINSSLELFLAGFFPLVLSEPASLRYKLVSTPGVPVAAIFAYDACAAPALLPVRLPTELTASWLVTMPLELWVLQLTVPDNTARDAPCPKALPAACKPAFTFSPKVVPCVCLGTVTFFRSS